MNKKFLSAILFGALMVTSTGTFVSCKDYDDDIKDLQGQVDANKKQIDEILAAINGKKFIQSYAPTENGYVLTFSDGDKLTITNGKDGAQGEQGLQGIQGPAGPVGATIIPQFKTDAESYWMISTDEGATYEYVLNEAGEKVKATGEMGGNNVKVDDEGYICIGDYKTAFKYDAQIPSMIYNEKDGTMQVTIGGQTYTLLMEGSAFNGLQTIVYRKQTQDDVNDVARAYQLYYPAETPDKEDVVFASVPAKAQFKVYPAEFSLTDAEFYFSDTYKTSRAAEPGLSYVPGSATLENGILSVSMRPVNMEEDDNYKTSLDVKMYKQYVTASDYFNVQVSKVSSTNINNVRVNAEEKILWCLPSENTSAWSNDEFDFNGQFNLNDSIDAAVYTDAHVLLNKTNIDYTQTFQLLPKDTEFTFNGETIKTQQGIFQIVDGVLSVKEQYQSSAINEYAGVEVTTVVKSQVEGVKDFTLKSVIFVKAVRPEVPVTYGNVELVPNEGNLALTYSGKNTQIIPLNVRKFQSEVGGRDIIAGNNNTWNYLLPLYAYNAETKTYVQVSTTNGLVEAPETNSTDLTIEDKDILLYYRNGGNNADKDSLFLMVGKSVELSETQLFVSPGIKTDGTNSWMNVWRGSWTEDGKPLAVYNHYDHKYFAVTLNNVSVTRNFNAVVREAYKAQTIIGEWSADKKTYSLESASFKDMYTITPVDAKAVYSLDAKKQNEYVQTLIKKDLLTFDNTTSTVKISPRADIAQVKELKIDIYDGSIDKDNFFRTDVWTVRSPLQDWAGVANLGKHYDPTLAVGSVVDFAALAKGSSSAWKGLLLKDYIDQTVIKYNTTTGAFDLLETEKGLYRQDAESTGLSFSTKTEGWAIEKDKLVLKEMPTGTVYDKTVTVTVSYVHDYGTCSFDFTINVIRDVNPNK